MKIALLVLVFGLGLVVAIRMARAVQQAIDAEKKKAAQNQKKRSHYHWVWGSIHWIWLAVIPAAKYVYREWKTAPPNSAEKFLWTMLFAAIAAVLIWVVLKIVDKAVNKEPKPATQPENARIR